METVKEAADSMLKSKKINKKEYEAIKKAGLLSLDKKQFQKIAFQSAFKDIAQKYLFPAAALSTVGVIGKETIVDPLIRSSKINSSFEKMQEKVPSLKGKSEKDLKDYFGVVKTFSPKAASNPLVAGALVNKMMEFGGVDHKLIQDLSNIEAGLARPSVVQSATEAAAKSISSVPGGD